MARPNRGDVSDNLWANDDESFEVQMPDFHFDWGMDKKDSKQNQPPSSTFGSLSIGNIPSHVLGSSASPEASSSTPPQLQHSSRSPLSSTRVTTLADRSIISTSPSIPTPPGSEVSHLNTRSLSAQNILGSGGSSSGASVKVYGQRKFQRVVSAPVPPRKETEFGGNGAQITEDTVMGQMDPSRPQNSAMRPHLAHTSSASSADAANIRPSLVTPGMTDRTLPTLFSAVRRTGGLSKFGGPARRVMASLDGDEPQESEERHSPALIESPPLWEPHSSSPIDEGPSASPVFSSTRNKTATSSRNHRPSPSEPFASTALQDLARTRSERTSALPRNQSGSSSALNGLAEVGRGGSTVPIEDRPYRPFGNDNRLVERHAIYPSEASSEAPRSAPPMLDQPNSPPYPNLRAGRPAPVVEPRHYAPPATISAPQHAPPPELINPGPVQQVASQPKSLFHVNGVTYERLQRLGKGGSSTVYSVLYSALKKRVIYALKVVNLDRADSETYQSYTNEIELLKRLRGHDRVIQLIDHQITFNQHNRPHRLLMVMECGEIDFAALLDEQRGKAVNMNFVGLYWEQMLEAVQAVHKENVVHTDLKPANFVLVKGRLKIIDFGIAKAVANDTVNIQRDQQIGTVNYMSPEAIQRMNDQKVLKLSYPSDVWSLGCILYQMIYGNPPFQHIGGGPLAKMSAIADPRTIIDYPKMATPKAAVGFSLDGRPINPETLSVPVSEAAILTMGSCLAYRKENRFTIPELLQHEFLKPEKTASGISKSTPITQYQMERLVNFIRSEYGLPELPSGDHTAEDLFSQLKAQNSLSG